MGGYYVTSSKGSFACDMYLLPHVSTSKLLMLVGIYIMHLLTLLLCIPFQYYSYNTSFSLSFLSSLSSSLPPTGKMLLDDKKNTSQYPFRRPYAVGGEEGSGEGEGVGEGKGERGI